jgi:hypothetical protein
MPDVLSVPEVRAIVATAPSPPRSVRLPRRSLWILVPPLLLPAVPIAAIVAPLMWLAGDELARFESLRRDGRSAEARLVDGEIYDKKVTRGLSLKTAVLTFEYRVDGVAYRAEKEFLAGETPPTQVAILYSASEPELHLVRAHPIADEELERLRRRFWDGLKVGAAVYAALLLLVVLPVGVAPRILTMRRQLDLARRGIVAEGVVRSIETGRFGERVCRYELKAADGSTVSGKAVLSTRDAERAGISPGRSCVALYDPNRPRRNELLA